LWFDVPLGAGSLALSTVYVFDLGVWATVWGALGGLCLQVIGLDERTEVAVSGADPGVTPVERERRETRA
jgi:multicomponent Na+:H+ antiporter subunit B